jgi:hypothetical protein
VVRSSIGNRDDISADRMRDDMMTAFSKAMRRAFLKELRA